MQELIAKDVEASDLDFSRYGDTFFEVRLFPLQNLITDNVSHLVILYVVIYIVWVGSLLKSTMELS